MFVKSYINTHTQKKRHILCIRYVYLCFRGLGECSLPSVLYVLSVGGRGYNIMLPIILGRGAYVGGNCIWCKVEGWGFAPVIMYIR